MKKSFLILVIIPFIIFSCAKKEEAIKGEQGGRLVIGTTELPSLLSPLAPSLFGSNEVLDLLFLPLHRVDPQTGRMKPVLALSWEFSEDLTSITYYLRKDVKWWDGQPVTAEDVLYTYERMKDPKVDYANIAALRFIKKVEVLGPHSIKFTFDRVYADILTDSDIMPIPKHVYEKIGKDFSTSPVGNGSYKIKEWAPGSGLLLTYNENYYRGRPPLDEIYIRNYTNIDDMLADFSRGDIDFILNITPAAAKILEENKNIKIDSRPGNTYTYVAWNLENSYIKDKEIRKALGMAIDRTKILIDVFKGMGKLSLGPLSPSSWGFNENITLLECNPTKAKDILRRKGFEDRNRNDILDKDGKEFTLNLITNVENPDRVEMLNRIGDDLKALGIRVNARALRADSFIYSIVTKKFDGFIMGWSVGEKIDPTVYWSSDGKFNFVSYKSSKVDSLIDVGVTLLNRKKAKDIWGEFQKTVYEDQPYTFLVVPNEISATYKRVKGTDEGIKLASAYTYWIPASERRIAVAVVIPPKKEEKTARTTTTPSIERVTPERPVERPARPPAVISPEKLIQAAAAKKETTIVATPPPAVTPPVAPPRPAVITKPVPVKQVKPKYPESARTVGAAGRVVVRVVVGTNGKVKAVAVISSFGNPACEEAALAAAKQWEFTPAMKDGVPFEQNISIPFDFKP